VSFDAPNAYCSNKTLSQSEQVDFAEKEKQNALKLWGKLSEKELETLRDNLKATLNNKNVDRNKRLEYYQTYLQKF